MTVSAPMHAKDQQRLYWADAAKAISIILVVLYHVVPSALGWLVQGQDSRGQEVLGELSLVLVPVRMPVFFMISGLLAARAIHRPWRFVAQKRVINLLWVFVLWTLVYAVPCAFIGEDEGLNSTLLIRTLLRIINLFGPYWFLSMLVIMFVILKLVLRVHPTLILSVAIILRLLAVQLPNLDHFFASDVIATVNNFCTYFLWYAIGALGASVMPHLVRFSKWTWFIAIPAFYMLTKANGIPDRDDNFTLILTIVGIIGIVGFSELITRKRLGQRAARYLATRTLPIYIFHALFIVLLRASNFRLGELTSTEAIALSLGLTAALTAISCLIWDITNRRLPYLFRAPTIINGSTPSR